MFGLLTPTRPFHDPRHFGDACRQLVDRIERSDEVAVEDLARYATDTASPLERIEGRLNLWVSFGIVPLFALVNAGVRLDAAVLDARVTVGVVLGLVLGKTVGVLGGAWIAVRLGVGRLPGSVTWRHMLGLAATAGIGFTVALFVTGLSFTDQTLTSSAKIGILLASTVAGVAGFVLLRSLPPRPHGGPSEVESVDRERRGTRAPTADRGGLRRLRAARQGQRAVLLEHEDRLGAAHLRDVVELAEHDVAQVVNVDRPDQHHHVERATGHGQVDDAGDGQEGARGRRANRPGGRSAG